MHTHTHWMYRNIERERALTLLYTSSEHWMTAQLSMCSFTVSREREQARGLYGIKRLCEEMLCVCVSLCYSIVCTQERIFLGIRVWVWVFLWSIRGQYMHLHRWFGVYSIYCTHMDVWAWVCVVYAYRSLRCISSLPIEEVRKKERERRGRRKRILWRMSFRCGCCYCYCSCYCSYDKYV